MTQLGFWVFSLGVPRTVAELAEVNAEARSGKIGTLIQWAVKQEL